MVMIEESAEPLASDDPACLSFWNALDQPIAQTLMGPLAVVQPNNTLSAGPQPRRCGIDGTRCLDAKWWSRRRDREQACRPPCVAIRTGAKEFELRYQPGCWTERRV
jgi:hypothetical protein